MRRRASFAEWLEGFKLRLSVEKRRLTSKQLLVAQAGDGWRDGLVGWLVGCLVSWLLGCLVGCFFWDG